MAESEKPDTRMVEALRAYGEIVGSAFQLAAG